MHNCPIFVQEVLQESETFGSYGILLSLCCFFLDFLSGRRRTNDANGRPRPPLITKRHKKIPFSQDVRETGYFSLFRTPKSSICHLGVVILSFAHAPLFFLAGRRKKFPWKEEQQSFSHTWKKKGGGDSLSSLSERSCPPQENWKQRSLIHFADLRNGLAAKGKLLTFFPHCNFFKELYFKKQKVVANFYVQNF